MAIVERFVGLLRSGNPPELSQQGAHVDPGAPDAPAPDLSSWPAAQRAAMTSPEMAVFRRNLTFGAADIRTSILDELAEYHGISADEALQRCRDWEALSVEEWQGGDRSDPDGLLAFYRTTQSWSFDLLWYAYLQAEGYNRPASVIALRWLASRGVPTGRHLDFGSGIGATAQLFHESGWTTTLADVSSTLLDFARFRLDRRAQEVRYIDLGVDRLPVGGFDVVTAIDALAHVPDIRATARELHATLAPGGLLLANIDARPPTPENAWHLYEDERSARYELQRAGFVPLGHDWLNLYRKVDPATVRHLARSGVDWVRLASPARRGLTRIVERARAGGLGS